MLTDAESRVGGTFSFVFHFAKEQIVKKRILAMLASAALIATSVASGLVANAAGTSTEGVTWVAPIFVNSNNKTADDAALASMKSRLGVGGTNTKLGWSFASWAMSLETNGATSDYSYKSAPLDYNLTLAADASLPVLVHMDDGRWADCCNSNSSGGWNTDLEDHIAAQPNTVMLNANGVSQYRPYSGGDYFSLSRLNTVYQSYKKRNVQAAAQVISTWATAHPGLFIGVSLDSETLYPSSSDYGVNAIQEWRDWLANTGIYGPGGIHFGEGRVPAFTVSGFNAAMSTSFASWSAVTPPTTIAPGQAFSEEWQHWRVLQIEHAVEDETSWIAAAGIDRTLIYGHQTPNLDEYGFADDIRTATASNGAGGTTMYSWLPTNQAAITDQLRGAGKNNWGVFEQNPQTTNSTQALGTLNALFNDGVKIICPNAWEVVSSPDVYSLFGSPSYGDTYGNAVRQFLADKANTPRAVQPPPWNPGTNVYDFVTNFSSATGSGPGNLVQEADSVGGVIRRGIFEHVGGTLTYSVALPSVSGSQRLNLSTSLGIKDGAGVGGGSAAYQVAINGANQLGGNGITLTQNDWQWKRWHPVMIDVTAWAGTTATFTFTTTGNSYYGWTQWGSPAIYRSTSGNDLAQGHSVTVSSNDGLGAGWSPAYLVDGNVDGGTAGRNGWSSATHTTPDATEWAAVDLGAVTSVGKVALFPRSDIGVQASTGFPTSFEIQGSSDGTTWAALVTETDYPEAKAGEAQIFTFAPVATRYVRVYATKLAGVAGYSNYWMQLTDMQVFAG